MTLTVGSLFSGIGGLDLGLERAGMRVRWQSEIDPYCSRVLAKHWPDVPNLGDVTKIDWEMVERVDLICGGFPCQPFSVAGRRLGRDDPRHLWPHFAAAIRVLRPRYALLENVPGILALGFGEVASDLADLGYDTEWDCIPAAAIGAPHLRYRVFVLAYAHRDGEPEQSVDAFSRSRVVVSDADGEQLRERTGSVPRSTGAREGETSERQRVRVDARDARPTLADTAGRGRDERQHGHGSSSGRVSVTARGGGRVLGDTDRAPENTHPTSSRSWGATGESGWWAVEPDVGRVAHGVPARVDRLRALGNAVVPQVAEWIGRQLLEAL